MYPSPGPQRPPGDESFWAPAVAEEELEAVAESWAARGMTTLGTLMLDMQSSNEVPSLPGVEELSVSDHSGKNAS